MLLSTSLPLRSVSPIITIIIIIIDVDVSFHIFPHYFLLSIECYCRDLIFFSLQLNKINQLHNFCYITNRRVWAINHLNVTVRTKLWKNAKHVPKQFEIKFQQNGPQNFLKKFDAVHSPAQTRGPPGSTIDYLSIFELFSSHARWLNATNTIANDWYKIRSVGLKSCLIHVGKQFYRCFQMII